MQPYAQTLPQIVVVNDLLPKTTSAPKPDVNAYLESLWHWEYPCEEETEDEQYFCFNSDEQEWREDYYASIQL